MIAYLTDDHDKPGCYKVQSAEEGGTESVASFSGPNAMRHALAFAMDKRLFAGYQVAIGPTVPCELLPILDKLRMVEAPKQTILFADPSDWWAPPASASRVA